ncbi:MAG: hypothetical protein B7Z20_03670 [Sphingobium sp. 32-64-5]|nr:MAG: hypothetical protein B7Z20_03670 [Sphingobium sp. 32-64-5]
MSLHMNRLAALTLLASLAAAQAPATAAAPLAGDKSRYRACLALAKSAPARAIASAQAWRIEGGDIAARHCLALAQFESRDYAAALTTFETAARQAESSRLTPEEAVGPALTAINLWTAATNAALLAGQPGAALRFSTSALALAATPAAEASLRVMRAEALVEMKRDTEAAADLEAATKADPKVQWGWLLKATLARRMGKLPEAEAAILEAAKQTPEDADVQLEAGNIAMLQGKTELARTAWVAASAVDPESEAGKAAEDALARLAAGTAEAEPAAATPPAPTPAPR